MYDYEIFIDDNSGDTSIRSVPHEDFFVGN